METKADNKVTYQIKGIGGAILAIAFVALVASYFIILLTFVAAMLLVYFFVLLCGSIAHLWNKILGRRRF
jgi:hypothetical protein